MGSRRAAFKNRLLWSSGVIALNRYGGDILSCPAAFCHCHAKPACTGRFSRTIPGVASLSAATTTSSRMTKELSHGSEIQNVVQ